MSKIHKFGIWQKIEEVALQSLKLSLTASLTNKETKHIPIRELRINIEILKHFIRLCFDIKVIEQKRYIILQEKLQEISKMSFGWEKYVK